MCATSIGSTFAHRPVIGVRKSGMPDGTEMPAPVRTTAGPEEASSSARRSRSLIAPRPAAAAPARRRAWSPALEGRGALLDERRDALATVLGAVHAQERVALGRQARVEVLVMRHALDLLDRERRLARQLAPPGQGHIEQLVVLEDAVDEPVLV